MHTQAGRFSHRIASTSWFIVSISIVLTVPNALQAQPTLNLDPPSIVNSVTPPKADERVDGEFSVKVTTLLDKLQNGSEPERSEAEKSLINLGPAVLAHLPHLRSSVKGDYRVALDRIRDSLQSKAIGEYAVASQITLQGKLPAIDVLLEIMDQSDNQLTMDTIASRDIDVNFQKATFWEALDFVLDEMQLEITTSAQDASLKLVPSNAPGTRVTRGSYAGVFRLESNRIDATRSMKSDAQNHLSIELSIAWEPRLRPVFFKFPMNSLLIECDNGEILEAAQPDASPEYTPTESHTIDAALMVELPSREAKRIRRMSGSLIAAIPGAAVQLEFDELDKPGSKSQKVGNLSVTVEEIKKREEIYEFKILISLREAGQTMDSFRGWLMSHQAYVLDAKDQRVENVGWQTYQMNSEAVGLTYFFDLGDSVDGCRLVYAAPGAVAEQRVDFLLKDIPLP
jgi:hypothetical protein